MEEVLRQVFYKAGCGGVTAKLQKAFWKIQNIFGGNLLKSPPPILTLLRLNLMKFGSVRYHRYQSAPKQKNFLEMIAFSNCKWDN